MSSVYCLHLSGARRTIFQPRLMVASVEHTAFYFVFRSYALRLNMMVPGVPGISVPLPVRTCDAGTYY